MTLYDITTELKDLEAMVDDLTIDDDGLPRDLTDDDRAALLALVDEIQGQFANKAERICNLMTNVKATSEACRVEEERLAKRRKAADKKYAGLKWLLETCMIRAGIDRAEAGTYKLAIQRNPPSVYVSQPSAVPEEWYRIIPEQKELDKRAMLEALKDGKQIPGAMLTQSSGLRIR